MTLSNAAQACASSAGASARALPLMCAAGAVALIQKELLS